FVFLSVVVVDTSLALVAVVVKCTLGHGEQRPVRLAVQSAQRCITALVGDVRFHDTVVGVLVHGDDDLSGSPVAVGAALNPSVVLGHDVFLSVVVVDTSIHTVAGIVKRAAPGLEPGCLPVRLWCIVTSLAGLAVLVKSPSVRRYRSRVGTRSDSSRSPPLWSPPQRARESASDAQRGRSPWPALAERPRVRRCLRC